ELQRRMTVIGGVLRRPSEARPRPPSERVPLPGGPVDELVPRPGGEPGEETAARPFPRPGSRGAASAGERGAAERVPEDARFPEAQPQVPPLMPGRPPVPDAARRDLLPPAPLPRRLSQQELSLFEEAASNAFYYAVWARDGRLLSRSESAP